DQAVALGQDAAHLARLAPVLTAQYEHVVVSPDTCHLDNLRRQGYDLHEVPLAQLPGDRADDGRAAGVLLLSLLPRGVVVASNDRAAGQTVALGCADDD